MRVRRATNNLKKSWTFRAMLVVFRYLWLRQVVARLRHALRRGAASLFGIGRSYARRLIDQAGVPEVDSPTDCRRPLLSSSGARRTRSFGRQRHDTVSLVRMLYSRAGAYPRNQPMLFAEDFSNTVEEPARHATDRSHL